MPFACIYVPNFPIAAALRSEPELRSRPLVILEGKPPLEKVVAVNEEARRLGIAPGVSKAQAELCSDLAMRPRSALLESSAHAALLDCAQSFSPCVEDAACDTALLDLAGMESLLGSLQKISRAISERAASLGLAANVAAACNPDAALLAARGFPGVTVIPPGKEAEHLGSLPPGVLFDAHIEDEEKKSADRLLETLDRWGIRSLRALSALPQVALSERLGQEGLRLQQLARGAAARTLVPVEAPLVFEEAVELEHPIVLLEPLAFLLNRLLDQLCMRLGTRALATQELRLTLELSNLTGMDDESENAGIPSESDTSMQRQPQLTMWGQPPKAISEQPPKPMWEQPAKAMGEQPSKPMWGQPAKAVGEQPSKPMWGQPAKAVGEQPSKPMWGQPPSAVRRSEAPLLSSQQNKFVRTLRLPLPMLDARIFLKLLQLDLNAHPPGAPIIKIHLAAEPARPRSAQGGLFLPPSPEPEKLELTLARIAGMVGENKVGALELLDTHHPEGFRMRRFVAEIARKLPQRKAHGPEEVEVASAVTALRRFRPPLRAHVTLQDGQPARVACPKKKEVQGDVLWKAGPWRFSGDWWERDAWSRDEWDLAVRGESTVSFYRLVHDLLEGGWFVEGTYD